MFSIGKDVSNNKSAGMKKKKRKLIPIHVTAKSMRQYNNRGRTVGLRRKHKDQEKRMQMLVSDEYQTKETQLKNQ